LRHESATPHKVQTCVVDILRCNKSAVGKYCLANLHGKTFIFEGTSTFHIFVQHFVSRELSELVERASSQASLLTLVSTSMRYADLTVKKPHFSKFQAQKSPTVRVHNGILLIVSISTRTKNLYNFSISQDTDVESISSLTSIGGSAARQAIGLID
jgi:hypothetical protein